MNDVRDYKVLRPIDVDSIYAEGEFPQEESTGPAYGNQYRDSRKNQDELLRDACWGRAQVYMSRPKADSEVAKRYKEICKIPVEQLLGDGEIEVEDFDADLFKKPIGASNPIKPQPFTLNPHKLNTYDTDLTLNDKMPQEDYTPTGENFFASNSGDFTDEYELGEQNPPQEENQEAA